MAYMNQERKQQIVAACKVVLQKYNVKATFKVDNHSTLVCTIKESPFRFLHSSVNHYWIEQHFEDHPAKDFLLELKAAMNLTNYDNSDIQSDYFDVGYYIEIKIHKDFVKPLTVHDFVNKIIELNQQ